MRKILFDLRNLKNDSGWALYLETFRKQGFTVVDARQESLLLRADAVLVFGNGTELSGEEMEYLTLAVNRNIPVLCVQSSLLDEKTKALLEKADVLDASTLSFQQLSDFISDRQKDIYAEKQEVHRNSRFLNIFFLIATAVLVLFLLVKITQFSRTETETLSSEEEKIAELVRQAAVRVYSIGTMNEESWRGSGFVVSRDGYIVTNAHVVDHAAVSYKAVYREQTYDSQVIAIAPEKDIALLKVDAVLHNTLVFAEDKPQKGDKLFAVGWPGDQKLSVITGTYEGNVSSFPPHYTGIRMPLKAGISGSPVVNAKGQVTGIASAVSRQDENEAWMVDGGEAVDFLKDYIFLHE